MRSVSLLSLATALAGCGAAAPATGFFPLEAGHRWTYDVKTEWDNNVVEHEACSC